MLVQISDLQLCFCLFNFLSRDHDENLFVPRSALKMFFEQDQTSECQCWIYWYFFDFYSCFVFPYLLHVVSSFNAHTSRFLMLFPENHHQLFSFWSFLAKYLSLEVTCLNYFQVHSQSTQYEIIYLFPDLEAFYARMMRACLRAV